MTTARSGYLLISLVSFVAPLTAETTTPSSPAAVHPESWPGPERAPARDARIERRVDELLSRMSLEEKAGQVIQGAITTVKPEDVKTYHLGSILNGGGGWAGDVRAAKPTDWLSAIADLGGLAGLKRSPSCGGEFSQINVASA